MAILSLFALTLLTSSHAFDLPSASEVVSKAQRRHSSMKTSVQKSADTLGILATKAIKSMPENIRKSVAAYHASPVPPNLSLMQSQDSTECQAALNQSCIAGFEEMFMAVLASENITAAADAATGYCDLCDDPEGQLETVITDCGLTGDDLEVYTMMGEFAAVACVDAECTGEVVWSIAGGGEEASPEAMRMGLCPNLECGEPVALALMNISGEITEEEFECSWGQLGVMCLTDMDDPDVYCFDLLGGENGIANMSEFCGTSCPGYLTLAMEDVEEACAGLMEGDEMSSDCDVEGYEEPSLNDLCITNADGDYCVDIIMDPANVPNVTECPAFGDPFEVPAPGVEPNATECSAECATQLESNTELPRGCCFASFFALSCTPEEVTTFIEDTCSVTLEACVPPEMPDTSTPTDGDGDSEEGTDDAAFVGVSVGVLTALGVASLAALL